MLSSLAALVFGCASSPPYTTASPTHESLVAFSQQGPQGARLPLSEMTPFAWDAVYVYPTGSKWQTINEETGLDVSGRRDKRYGEPGPLLVFTSGGAVVEALAVTPPLQVGLDRAARLGAGEATVLALSKPPAPHALVIEGTPQPQP